MSLLQNSNAITPASGFELKSIRFNDNDSAKLSRTNTVVGNRKTWTLSFWFKLANRASGNHTVQMLFKAGTAGQNSIDALFSVKLNPDMIQISSNNDIVLKTNRLFRDFGAWYHMVCVMDTVEGSAADRFKIYINGVRETSFQTDNISTYVTQNLNTAVNNTVLTQFGFDDDTTYCDGYQAEAYLLDGSAVGPEYFGETDTSTNQWVPLDPTDIKQTVSFGTNGFYLPFSNDALTTSFKDMSGSDKTLFNSSADLTLGMGDNETGYQLNGYLDEVRISSVCRYPGGALFSPSTTAFTSDADTVLLLHGDGADGGTTFTDSSSNNYTLTASGNTHTDTSVKKIGTASIQLDGTGDYLSLADNSNLNFANNPFTVEFWVYFNSVGSGVYVNPMGQGQESAGTSCWYLHIDPTNVKFRYSENGTTTTQLAYSQTLSASTWYHFAITRDDTVGDQKIYVYQDGVSRVSGAVGHTVTPTGDVHNTRVSNLPVAVTGDAHVIGPAQGTSVIHYDGSGDSLTVPASADWNFGTGDFTIEFWANIQSGNGYLLSMGTHDGASSIAMSANTANGNTAFDIRNDSSTNTNMVASGIVYANRWYHYAVCRNGSKFYAYIDGVFKTSGDNDPSGNYGASTNVLYSGQISSGGFSPAEYIDSIRISKGVARYPGGTTFTPPTEAFVSDANTVFLLQSGTDGTQTPTTDTGNTGHTITYNGDARWIAPKFGKGCAYFDGTNDGVSIANNVAINLAGGDFTIDLWFKGVDVDSPNLQSVLSKWNVDNIASYYLLIHPTAKLRWYLGDGGSTGNEYVGDSTIADNTWYHAALTRSGNIFYCLSRWSRSWPNF